MSKFDFARLREQVKQTNETLKEVYKGTDKQIEARLNWINDEEIQKKRIASLRSEETSKKLSEGHRKRYENPEERKKTGLATKKSFINDPTRKQKAIEASKKIWSNPALKKQASKSHKKQWKDKSKRKQLSNSMKEIRKYPIMTPDGEFESTEKAAEHFGVSRATINYRIGKYPEQYYYCGKKPHCNKKK